MQSKVRLGDFFPDVRDITVLDIGAMTLGSEKEYAPLVAAGAARIVGFEPDRDECDKLNRAARPGETFLPYFIGDGGGATYHKTNYTMTGSLFAPNRRLVDMFNNLGELLQLEAKHPVETHRLDDIAELRDLDIDCVKIDIQGGELAAFQAAARILSQCTVIQTEVEFVEIYEGQPLFADVDRHLRGCGFQLHAFLGFGKRCFKPIIVGNDPNQGLNQVLWSDAVYVRDFTRLDRIATDKLIKMAIVLNDVYGSFDLVTLALMELDRRLGSEIARDYMQKICG
jgi:FkbM family methyltransferase